MESKVVVCVTIVSLCVVVVVLGCDSGDDQACIGSNRMVCSGRGVCDCGTCKCDAPYTGSTCEDCPTCTASCEDYRSCVSCKVFSTGPYSNPMACLEQCDGKMWNLIMEEMDPNTTLQLCQYLNTYECVESFWIGDVTSGYRDVYVKSGLDCLPLPTYPTLLEVTVGGSNTGTETADGEAEPTGYDDKGYESSPPESVDAVSGSKEIDDTSSGRSSSAAMFTIASLSVVLTHFL